MSMVMSAEIISGYINHGSAAQAAAVKYGDTTDDRTPPDQLNQYELLSVFKCRRRGRPTTLGFETHERHVAHHYVASDVLRQKIRRVINPQHFSKFEVATLQTVLDPKIRNMQVSNLAQAAPSTNADRRSGVGKNFKLKVNAKVGSKRLASQSNGRASADATELCFPRGQCDSGLSQRPMLNGMSSQ